MGVPYMAAEIAFKRALVPDQIPQEGWDQLREFKEKFLRSGITEDLMDSLAEVGFLTVHRALVAHWREEWERAHPTDAQTIDRFQDVYQQYMSDDLSQIDTDATLKLADELIEQEEPGLTARFEQAIDRRELYTVRQMKQFCTRHDIMVPGEITTYILQEEGRLRGKEQ